MQRSLPIFRWGNHRTESAGRGPGRAGLSVLPVGPTRGDAYHNWTYRLERLHQGRRRAMASYWDCVNLLAKEGVDVIVFGGAPISAQLGRKRALGAL